jgi:hypothetical protein
MFIVVTALVCHPGAAAGQSDSNIYLETVGGFGGSYIYMTYAYIGVTADAFSKNIYQANQVKVMMEETVSMINNLMKMLTKVQATNIVANDKVFVDSMLEILDLLKIEAESLAAFAGGNNPADVEKYDSARKQVWPKIKTLLGIK